MKSNISRFLSMYYSLCSVHQGVRDFSIRIRQKELQVKIDDVPMHLLACNLLELYALFITVNYKTNVNKMKLTILLLVYIILTMDATTNQENITIEGIEQSSEKRFL